MKLASIFITLLLAFALLASDTIAQPGLYTAINSNGVNRAAEKVLPGFLDRVRGMTFPNINDGHHRILDPTITEIWLSSFEMSITDDGITTLRIHQFNISAEFRYRYKRKWLRITTGVRATLGDANFTIQIRLFNDGGRFGLGVEGVHVDAGEASIKILGKSIKSKMMNAIKSLFKSQIRNAILNNVRDALYNGIVEFGSNFVANINLRMGVGDWGSIDLSLVDNIRYGFNSIIVGFSGDVQYHDEHVPTPVPRPDLPFHPHDQLFSVGVSTFVFNSGFYNYAKKDLFFHMTTKQEPHSYTGEKLESKVWAKQIPAIQKKFPDKDLRIILRHGIPPTLNSSGGVLKFHADIYAHIQAGHGDDWADWANAFVLNIALDASATVALYENRVFPQIQDVTTNLSVVESNIGNIDLAVAVVQHVFQYGTDIAVPIINSQLLPGIPIPINGHIILSDPQLALPENMMVLSTNVDFQF